MGFIHNNFILNKSIPLKPGVKTTEKQNKNLHIANLT